MIKNIPESLEENKVFSKDKKLYFDSFNIFLSLDCTNTTNARAERKKKKTLTDLSNDVLP